MPQLLSNVPQEIRYWLGSESVTYFLRDLNNKLNITGDRVSMIPRLIYRLETLDLAPQKFIDYLTEELKITPSAAREIAREVEQKILEPIKRPLYDWGMDVSLIQTAEPVTPLPKPEEINLEPTIKETPAQPIVAVPKPVGPQAKIEIVEAGAGLKAPGTAIEPKSGIKEISPLPAPEETSRIKTPVTPPSSLPKIQAPAAPPREIPKFTPPPKAPEQPEEKRLSTLRKEGDKVKLKEEMPFMLHEENKIPSVAETEIGPGYRPNPMVSVPKFPKTPATPFQVESLGAESEKPSLKSSTGEPKILVNLKQETKEAARDPQPRLQGNTVNLK